MRRVALLLLSGLALAAAPASAALFVFQAPLTGGQERPMVATPGSGFTTVTYDDGAHTLRVQASFAGLIGNTTMAHIHVLPAVTPLPDVGGVATELPSFTGFPLGVKSGTYDHLFNLTLASSFNPAFVTNFGGGTVAGAETAFFNALQTGRAYLNIHTHEFPAGEIRGNLQFVPEPATWAMMLVGFGLAGATLRYRRRRTTIRFAAG